MSETRGRLLHREITDKIIRGFFEVCDDLGYGYLESAYQGALPIALQDLGLTCQQQVLLPVHFRGRVVCQFRADLIVENKVIIETKTAATIHPVHVMQLRNYLKATSLEVGLLLNFGPKPEFQRYVLSDRSSPSA